MSGRGRYRERGRYRGRPYPRAAGHYRDTEQGKGSHHEFWSSTRFWRGQQYGRGASWRRPCHRGTTTNNNHFRAATISSTSQACLNSRGRGNNFTERSLLHTPHQFSNNETSHDGQGQARGYCRALGESRRFRRSTSSNNWRQLGHQKSALQKQDNKGPKEFLDFSFLVKPDSLHLMKEFKVMIILRGVPGSGKSTLAKAILERYQPYCVVCSADSFRYNQNGEYVWSKEMLGLTHAKCQRQTEEYCEEEKPVVIIDNTNVTYPEISPYIQIAKRTGYVVVLIEPKTPWKTNARELVKRNSHNVSFTKLRERIERFQDINPLYFGWFLSKKYCSQIRKTAIGILNCCLGIAQFKQCMAQLSGKSVLKYSIPDLINFYCMRDSSELHVTSCFSPRGRYLGHSLYNKSCQVQDSLGCISWITIIGWAITEHTFTARVSLSKQQQRLWKNDIPNQKFQESHQRINHREPANVTGQFSRDRGGNSKDIDTLSSLEKLKIEDRKVEGFVANSVNMNAATTKDENYSKDVEICLKPNYGCTATAHITLGKQITTKPVQAKHDMQTIVNYEVGNYPFERYCVDDGTIRNYEGNIWVFYLNKAINIPGVFSGYYE